LQQLIEIPDQLRQGFLMLAGVVGYLGASALAERVVLALVIGSVRAAGAVIGCGWYQREVRIVDESFPFIDESMPLSIVAQLMLVSVIDPTGLGVIDDGSPATSGGNFYHEAIQEGGHDQPKRDGK
jgi:hypothetical protein